MPNRSRRPKRPRDLSKLAKLIVNISTGETEEVNPDEGKDPAAIRRGHLGGIKGGHARAKSLTAKDRSRIAKKAATARWKQR
jgi:hypothetical protein